jgi:hypothetical protein
VFNPVLYAAVKQGKKTLTTRTPKYTAKIGLRVGEVAKAKMTAKGKVPVDIYTKFLGTYATGEEMVAAVGGVEEYARREGFDIYYEAEILRLKGQSLFEISLEPISGYDEPEDASSKYSKCSTKPDLSILPIAPAILSSYIQANLLYASSMPQIEQILQESTSIEDAVQNLIPTFGPQHAKEVLALRLPDPDPSISWTETKKTLVPAGTDFADSPTPDFGIYSRLFGKVGSDQALRACFGEKSGPGVPNLHTLYTRWDISRASYKHVPGYFALPGPVAAVIAGRSDNWMGFFPGESEGYVKRPEWLDLAPVFQARMDAKAEDICILLPVPIIKKTKAGDVDITGQEGYLNTSLARLRGPEFFREMYSRLSVLGAVDEVGTRVRKDIDLAVARARSSIKIRYEDDLALLGQRKDKAKAADKDGVEELIKELKRKYFLALEEASAPQRKADAEKRKQDAELLGAAGASASTQSPFSFSIHRESQKSYYGSDPEAVQRWPGHFIGYLYRSFGKGWTRDEVQFRLNAAQVMLPHIIDLVKSDSKESAKEIEGKMKYLKGRDIPYKDVPPAQERKIYLDDLPSQESAHVLFFQNPLYLESYLTAPLVPMYIEIVDENKQLRDNRKIGDVDAVLEKYEEVMQGDEKPKGFLPMFTAYARLYRKSVVKARFGSQGVALLKTHCLLLAGHRDEWYLGFPAALSVEKNWSQNIGRPAEMERHHPYMIGKTDMPTVLRRLMRMDLISVPTGYHLKPVALGTEYPWTSAQVPYLMDEFPVPVPELDEEGSPAKDKKGRIKYSDKYDLVTWDEKTARTPGAHVDPKAYADIVREAFSAHGIADYIKQGASRVAEGFERGGTARAGGRRQVSGMPVDRPTHSSKGLYALVKTALFGFKHRDIPPDSLGEVGALHDVIRNNWANILDRINETRKLSEEAPFPADTTALEMLESPQGELAALDALEDIVRTRLDLATGKEIKTEQYRALMQKSLLKPWRKDLEETNSIRVASGQAPLPQNVPEGFLDDEYPIFAEDVVDTIRAIENRGRARRQPRPPRPQRSRRY